jgi:hypothetical protein
LYVLIGVKTRTTIFILLVVLLSCKKSSTPNITLSTNLTNCPANSTCTYSYYNNADFVNADPPVHGSFRVFSYQSVNQNVCGAMSQFYFKTSLSDANFDITSNQIASGQVFANYLVCPCCDYALLLKPIGGEIKGERISANHWLVNATIVFGTSVGSPADTLVVNQYFSQQPLP